MSLSFREHTVSGKEDIVQMTEQRTNLYDLNQCEAEAHKQSKNLMAGLGPSRLLELLNEYENFVEESHLLRAFDTCIFVTIFVYTTTQAQ